MPNYTAITIGPISDTMALTSSPAGLWGTSYLFSWTAKALILSLLNDGVPADAFVAPYFQAYQEAGTYQIRLYDPNKLEEASYQVCADMQAKGVGLFHDRVIFQSDEISDALEKVRSAQEKVMEALAGKLNKNNLTEWLTGYIRIYAAEAEVEAGQSPLMVLGDLLSAMELEPHFQTKQGRNDLLDLFENDAIKKLPLVTELDRWMLYTNNTKNKIRDIEHIAAQGVAKESITKKYQQYYAILKSDGDSMSSMLDGMDNPEQIRAYSRQCLKFCADAAKMILDFGGMPIYAGGDDLLALVPVMGKGQTSVLALVNQLRELFNQSFADARSKHKSDDGRKLPTISFGVSVQYKKSPLYEALEQSDTMLRTAKAKNSPKNACYLNVRKHSGQSMMIVEEKMDINEPNLYELMETLYSKTQKQDADQTVTFLYGAGHQIEHFKSLFLPVLKDEANRKKLLQNLMKNLFDNADQKKFQPYLEEIGNIILLIIRENPRKPDEKDDDYLERVMMRVQASIRLIHFLNEKKGKEDETGT